MTNASPANAAALLSDPAAGSGATDAEMETVRSGAFLHVYHEWLAARGNHDVAGGSDEEVTAAVIREDAAEMAVISTPALNRESLVRKLELLDVLLAEECLGGQRKHPLAIVAVAAIKADALAIEPVDWR